MRKNYIYRGNPSALHKWWAQRPLAAARAVIYAQMVDDPSANPDLFPTEKAQEKERTRPFKIIDELVQWESTTNEADACVLPHLMSKMGNIDFLEGHDWSQPSTCSVGGDPCISAKSQLKITAACVTVRRF